MKHIVPKAWNIAATDGVRHSKPPGVPPAQVTGLEVHAFATYADAIWNSVSGAVDYVIRVNGTVVATVTVPNYRIWDLTAATAYTVTVRARNAQGEGVAATQSITTLSTPGWVSQPVPLFELGVASNYELSAFVTPGATGTYANIGVALDSRLSLNSGTGQLAYDGSATGGILDTTGYTFRFDPSSDDPVTDATSVRTRIADTTVPTAPTSLGSAAVTQSTFTLSWTQGTDAGGIAQNKIYRNGVLYETISAATSRAITGQSAAATNTWRVSAVDPSGNESPPSAAVSVQQSANSATAHYHPLTFVTNYGVDPAQYTTSAKAKLANRHIVLMAGDGDGWTPAGSTVKEDIIQSIKSQSSINTKVWQYVAFNEMFDSSSARYAAWKAKCDSAGWWLYQAGTSGAKAVSIWSANYRLTNFTHAVSQSGGLWPYEWAAQFVYDTFINSSPTSKRYGPSIDAFFLDNFFWQPRVDSNADWNRDGVADMSNNATVQLNFRTGERDFITKLKQIWPNKLYGGNPDWYNAGSLTNPAVVTPLNGICNIAMYEGGVGQGSSAETWSGTQLVLDRLKFFKLCLVAPRQIASLHIGIQLNGSDAYDTTPYRAARYMMAISAMFDEVYTGFSPGLAHNNNENTLYTFDEMHGGSLNEYGWLGASIDPDQSTQRSGLPAGVFAREFENGLVLMVAKGIGQVTITMSQLAAAGLGGSGTWRRLSGTQAASVNNGQLVTSSIVLGSVVSQSTPGGRDGLFLRREP